MSNNKQTAVEFLFELLPTIVQRDLKHKFEQAKQMEKEQIVESYRLGHIFHDSNDSDSPEEYYNTEYGKQ